jgi:hypothetical protein
VNSINKATRFLNYALLILLCIIYITVDYSNIYDALTFFLLYTWIFFNIFALKVQRLNGNEPLLLMIMVTSVFYIMRAISLAYYQTSGVIDFNLITIDQVNVAILYILLTNIAIFLGFICFRRAKKGVNSADIVIDYQELGRHQFILISMAFFSLSISFTSIFNIHFDGITALAFRFLANYNPYVLLLSLFFVLSLSCDKCKRISLSLGLMLLFYGVIHSTAGSKSGGFFNIAVYTSLAFIVARDRFHMKNINIILLLLTSSVTMIVFYYYGLIQRTGLPIEHFLSLSLETAWFDKIMYILEPIFSRIGYLDHTMRFFINYDLYEQNIDLAYYLKSIVDNVLSPGAVVFDAPFVNYTLKWLDYSGNMPSMELTESEYHSTILTLYSENFLLFMGWLSLIPVFLFSFLFNRFYYLIFFKRDLNIVIYRVFMLFTLFIGFKSFGYDWNFRVVITYILTIGAYVFLIVPLFTTVRGKLKEILPHKKTYL